MPQTAMNKLYDAGCAAYDYAANQSFKLANKLTHPVGSRKLGKLILSSFSNLEYYTGNKYIPAFTNTIKGGVDLIDFGSTAILGTLLLNPLNARNLDYAELEKSLRDTLPENQKKSVASVMTAFKKEAKDITHRQQAMSLLTDILVKQGIYTAATDAETLLGRVTIQTKSRPVLKTINLALSLVCTLGSNLKSLDKFGILSLAQISTTLGATKVFGFVAHVALDTTLGIVSCAANVVLIAHTAWDMIDARHQLNKGGAEENEDCHARIKNGWWILAAEITDLASTALPMAFVTLNPPVVLGLGLIAKSVGLVAFCNTES